MDEDAIPRCFIKMSMNKFEGYTQHEMMGWEKGTGCFIRMSMNNLKDIHNSSSVGGTSMQVVLSGFQ